MKIETLEVQSEKVDVTFLEVVPGVAVLLDGVVPDDWDVEAICPGRQGLSTL